MGIFALKNALKIAQVVQRNVRWDVFIPNAKIYADHLVFHAKNLVPMAVSMSNVKNYAIKYVILKGVTKGVLRNYKYVGTNV